MHLNAKAHRSMLRSHEKKKKKQENIDFTCDCKYVLLLKKEENVDFLPMLDCSMFFFFTEGTNKMLISWQCVTTEMLISFKEQ